MSHPLNPLHEGRGCAKDLYLRPLTIHDATIPLNVSGRSADGYETS